MMRAGLKRIIASTTDMVVVGEAVDSADVQRQIGKTDCDVLTLDMTMPGLSGIELIKEIKKQKPGLPILILSMHNVGKIAGAALRAGAGGYLTKDADPERLIEAIQKLAGGGKYIDPAMVDKLVFDGADDKKPHENLSERERQIFFMIVAGQSTSQIAADLGLSAKTVSTHKKRIMEKMDVDNGADLVRYAIEKHLVA
ncbi:DNA-binding response regulator [Noviherbaspirillum cavernae]|uniref:DNA-binding response regulator n=2 Tax=Noviherbaspirillum cavernae TaxID=2320862 RepID=A0A418WWL6_9BURK|nr:DNA-binding response regulator [Noviherbaspirillum cavernae]